MDAVEYRGVGKTYDHVRWILRDASFTVAPGELTVLMGRSGSGKSTLLHFALGLDRPSEGTVLVDGVDVASLDEDARAELRLHRVGAVFQRFHLIPELTVEENVRLPLGLAKRSDESARARSLLEFFGLEARSEAFPATLSGGEAQRAAIARALGNEPRVLLADEPTANLDDANARLALEALRRVADELGTAVLVASHDDMALEVADRALALEGGRVRLTTRSDRAAAAARRPSRAPSPPG